MGISQLLAGDLGAADDVLAEAVEVAQDTGATVAVTVALAERAILAIGRQDWQDAETLVAQARSLVASAHLEECVTSLVVYAAAARVAIHHGDVALAQQELARAQRLRPQATHALPYYAVQARLELIRAYLALTDVAAAQTVFARSTSCCGGDPTWASSATRPTSSAPNSTTSAASSSAGRRYHRRVAPGPPAGHLSHVPGDGRELAPLPAHGEEPGPVDLPQARRLHPRPGGPAGAGDRPARQVRAGWSVRPGIAAVTLTRDRGDQLAQPLALIVRDYLE